jgi:hypothetical protein
VYGKWQDGDPEPTVTVNGVEHPISSICDKLSTSKDSMPAELVTALHLQGDDHSYAYGARMLKEYVVAQKATPSSASGWRY